jgi:hypothetical protein
VGWTLGSQVGPAIWGLNSITIPLSSQRVGSITQKTHIAFAHLSLVILSNELDCSQVRGGCETVAPCGEVASEAVDDGGL